MRRVAAHHEGRQRNAVCAALCDAGAGRRPGTRPADDPAGVGRARLVQRCRPTSRRHCWTAFRRYTIANYVNSFDNFTGQHFDVAAGHQELPNGEQVVQTRIISSSGEYARTGLRDAPGGGAWKAVDVLADGSISRVAVQRSDFRRLVAHGGAQALIESLNQKTTDLSGGALP